MGLDIVGYEINLFSPYGSSILTLKANFRIRRDRIQGWCNTVRNRTRVKPLTLAIKFCFCKAVYIRNMKMYAVSKSFKKSKVSPH